MFSSIAKLDVFPFCARRSEKVPRRWCRSTARHITHLLSSRLLFVCHVNASYLIKNARVSFFKASAASFAEFSSSDSKSCPLQVNLQLLGYSCSLSSW